MRPTGPWIQLFKHVEEGFQCAAHALEQRADLRAGGRKKKDGMMQLSCPQVAFMNLTRVLYKELFKLRVQLRTI